MSVRKYRQRMLILLIIAQTFLGLSGLFDILDYRLFQSVSLVTSLIVLLLIIVLKFFWHIQDVEIGLTEKMRTSHFGVYLFATFGLPFIFMTPLVLLYLGVNTDYVMKIVSIVFLFGAVLFECLMFSRLVDYFCEDEAA